MEINIQPHERLDDLHRNGYKIIQDPSMFCFGCDAVLLSDFAKVRKNEKALDMGTGTGIIPVLLEAKNMGKQYIGLEIQEKCVEMARRSIELNGLSHKIEIHLGDIKFLKNLYKAADFDVVTTNPPYMNIHGGIKNECNEIAVARHEILVNLEEVVSGAAYLLKPQGRFYMIHRPSRLAEIMYLLKLNRLEPKTIRLIQPYIDKKPIMVLIEAIKNANSMLNVLPTLIIYKEKNVYTDEVYKIYYE